MSTTIKKQMCPTCGAPVSPQIYSFDIIDAKLLVKMARVIRAKQYEHPDRSFKDANKVHVPTLDATDAERHRTTKCSKLGLVAKFKENGKQTAGNWLITARGWAALRGEKVPKTVEVFRKQIVDRKNVVTTIADLARDAQHRYDAQEWVEFSNHTFAIVDGEVVEKTYGTGRLL